MRATKKSLAAGVSAALLLLLTACGEPEQSSDEGSVAPAAGDTEPAAPATEGTTTNQ